MEREYLLDVRWRCWAADLFECSSGAPCTHFERTSRSIGCSQGNHTYFIDVLLLYLLIEFSQSVLSFFLRLLCTLFSFRFSQVSVLACFMFLLCRFGSDLIYVNFIPVSCVRMHAVHACAFSQSKSRPFAKTTPDF